MQTAEILLDVIQKRGIEGKPLERLYRKLFNKGIYRLAYSRIYANQGALTPGIVETDTLDGMSEERMDKIIKKVKTGNYRWNPVRRTHIPKPKGGKRPLGIPSGEDKLLQAALKILIETYYEPQFSERSHGFRPNRGCHTALNQINQKHRDVSWFIEGDIKGCFDNIDHDILLEIMGEKIKDQPLLRLLKNLMKSGYVEDWKWGETLSGTPQGGIISPLLSNIYMDKFDRWVEKTLLPDYNFGQVDQGNGHKTRRINPEYKRLSDRRVGAKRRGDKEAYKHYGNLMRKIPTRIDDENYRKLEYIRYADDFLLSFKGPKKEAEEIREKIKSYLKKELKLELSIEKTLITHAKTEKAKFLGYNLRIMQSESRRKANGAIWYGVPREVIGNAIKKHKKKDKITHRNELIAESDYSIISQYQAEYRGLVQFYTMAHNLDKLKKVEWVMGTSLLKTLAAKHKTSVAKTASRLKSRHKVNGVSYRILEVKVEREGKKPLTTHFGGIPLTRSPSTKPIQDNIPKKRSKQRSEILTRMMAENCEMCGAAGPIEVHHVRGLKDLNQPGKKTKPAWVQRMAALKRKTLMTCKQCHKAIHTGTHRKEWTN